MTGNEDEDEYEDEYEHEVLLKAFGALCADLRRNDPEITAMDFSDFTQVPGTTVWSPYRRGATRESLCIVHVSSARPIV